MRSSTASPTACEITGLNKSRRLTGIINGDRKMPKFENVSCSNCGRTFGPRDHGFSHCEQHAALDKAGDLISRSELLTYLRKEREAYFREHFFQDPATGTYEASEAKEEYLEYLDERIDLIDNWPPVGPVAKLVNNNQPGWLNIIETAPNVTIDIGTDLYVGARP
jgi:hypothetical protein